jgi:hypothetical protein
MDTELLELLFEENLLVMVRRSRATSLVKSYLHTPRPPQPVAPAPLGGAVEDGAQPEDFELFREHTDGVFFGDPRPFVYVLRR